MQSMELAGAEGSRLRRDAPTNPLAERWAAFYAIGEGGVREQAEVMVQQGHARGDVELARARALEIHLWGAKLPACAGFAPWRSARFRRSQK